MIPFKHNDYPHPSRRNAVYGKRGIISTSHPLATEAGMVTLRRGGNAIDAAVAAAAALSVVDPASTGPGGDLFAIVSIKGKLYGLNASGHSAEKMTIDEIKNRGLDQIPGDGMLSVSVSGGPAGWAALSERFGKMDLKSSFAPAIELAQGFPIDGGYAGSVNDYVKTIDEKNDVAFEPWKDFFTPDRMALQAGQTVCLRALGETLEEIAETKAESFYRGRLAKAMSAHSESLNGLLSYDDFASYQPEWVEPVSVHYHGYDIWELPPNGQGLTPIIALNIMEGFKPITHDDALTVHRQIECMKLAFADAFAYIADPNFLNVSVESLLSKEYAASRRSLIGDDAVIPIAGEPYQGGTVYLCAADGDGNMISLIQSVANHWGSGIVVPGTGILLQNRASGFNMKPGHPNCAGPRKRAFNTIIPGFISKDGVPVGPVGVMGGFMQPQGHMQMVMNMIDFEMNPQAALDAPRWFWQKDLTVKMETSWPNAVIRSLTARGHVVEVDDSFYGRGQIIVRLENGTYCGGAEPRGGGAVMAY